MFNREEYLAEGRHQWTYHHFYVVFTFLSYLISGGYSVYSGWRPSTLTIARAATLITGWLSALFVLSVIDHIYFALQHNETGLYLVYVVSFFLYLFGYINHYDFRKKYKRGKDLRSIE